MTGIVMDNNTFVITLGHIYLNVQCSYGKRNT